VREELLLGGDREGGRQINRRASSSGLARASSTRMRPTSSGRRGRHSRPGRAACADRTPPSSRIERRAFCRASNTAVEIGPRCRPGTPPRSALGVRQQVSPGVSKEAGELESKPSPPHAFAKCARPKGVQLRLVPQGPRKKKRAAWGAARRQKISRVGGNCLWAEDAFLPAVAVPGAAENAVQGPFSSALSRSRESVRDASFRPR